jgi:hypothetical protein
MTRPGLGRVVRTHYCLTGAVVTISGFILVGIQSTTARAGVGYREPVPALCPLCGLDDYTSAQKTEDGLKDVVCSNPSHGTDGFVWEPTQPSAGSHRSDGLGCELRPWAA